MRNTQKWDAPGILAEVKRRASNLTALAREAGLQDSACRTSLSRPFPAADKAISDFLGVPLGELWPDRYEKDGMRKDRRTIRYRAHNKRDRSQTHRQNAGAR